MTDPCKCPLCGERTVNIRNEYLWALERLAKAAEAKSRVPLHSAPYAQWETAWHALDMEFEAALAAYREMVKP